MTALFQGLTSSLGSVLQIPSGTRLPDTLDFRGLAVNPEGFVLSTPDTGQARAFINGLAVDKSNGILLTTQAPGVSFAPGGIAVDANGAVSITPGDPLVIHQGVGLTADGRLALRACNMSENYQRLAAQSFTASGNGTAQIISGGTPDGQDCIEGTIADSTGTLQLDFSFAGPGVTSAFGLWIAWVDAPNNVADVTIHSGQNWSSVRHTRTQSWNTQLNSQLYNDGWKFLNIPLEFSAWQVFGGDDWTQPRDHARVGLNCSPGFTNQRMRVMPCYYNLPATPRLILTFDDGNDTDYSVAFDYMKPRGLRGTSFVPSSVIGGVEDLSLAQIEEMYAAGWDMGVHGTFSWRGIGTEAVQSHLEGEIDYFLSRGLGRGAFHCAYVGGQYDPDVLPALQNVGMKTARNVLRFPFNPRIAPNWYEVPGIAVDNNQTPTGADALADLDAAIKESGTMVVYIHKIGDAGGSNWQVQPFRDFIDGIVTRRDAGTIEVLTMSEYYELVNRGCF